MTSRGGGRPKVGLEQFKDVIYNLYIVDKQELKDVRQYLSTRHGFNARYGLFSLYFYIY